MAIGAATALAASIPNGGFENGNFSGWTKKNTADASQWKIYTAKSRELPGPPNASPLAPRPIGKYASVLEQEEPSTNYLTRTISVPSDATRLTVKLFWVNRGDGPPPSVSSAPLRASVGYWRFPGEWIISGPRIQYFMLDIVKPSANGFTTKKSDILTTLFRPTVGSTRARSGGWVNESLNVTRFRGSKIKLRLVEADNSGFLNIGLDQLALRSANTPTG